MNFTISLDPLHLIGIIVCAYFASLLGSLIGTIIVAVFTPGLDGQRLWKSIGLLTMAGQLTPIKLIIATVVGLVSICTCSTTGGAFLVTTLTSATVALLFTLFAGFSKS